ncbi:MAG: PIG-L family deacetylase [Bryobacterales bacterium]|nr:PIG-L family deacetylase [Bryobacterales bacterium]
MAPIGTTPKLNGARKLNRPQAERRPASVESGLRRIRPESPIWHGTQPEGALMFYPTLDVTGLDPLDVLAVAAHPGDAEWFCGGVLAAEADGGKRTGILDLSTGDMSARGIPQQRVAEAEEAATHLGLAWRGNLGLPDGRLENNILARMTLAGIIRTLQPKVVIGPHPNRLYPDHRYAWDLLQDACQVSGWPKLDDDLPPHRPTLLLQGMPDLPQAPALLSPLTAEQLSKKIAALSCYRSQLQPGVHPADPFPFTSEAHLRAAVTASATHYALTTPHALAEPFWTHQPLITRTLTTLG